MQRRKSSHAASWDLGAACASTWSSCSRSRDCTGRIVTSMGDRRELAEMPWYRRPPRQNRSDREVASSVPRRSGGRPTNAPLERSELLLSVLEPVEENGQI